MPDNKVQVKLTSREGEVTIVEAEIERINPKTVWVRLPDGNLIKRHKTKHLIRRSDDQGT